MSYIVTPYTPIVRPLIKKTNTLIKTKSHNYQIGDLDRPTMLYWKDK